MLPAPVVAARLTRRLAALGAASTVLGLALATRHDATGRAFGQQTAVWGLVDLTIAGVSAARSATPPTADRLRTVLLVNVGLDVLYVAGGAHLAVRRPGFGGRLGPAAARGHGGAVVVQGALLLLLDAVHAQLLRPVTSASPPVGARRR